MLFLASSNYSNFCAVAKFSKRLLLLRLLRVLLWLRLLWIFRDAANFDHGVV